MDQLLESDVHKRVGLEEPMDIRVLVTGKGGVGKSVVVNALVGMDITGAGDDVVSVTKEVKRIEAAKNGIHVYVTEIPGLGDLDIDSLHKALEHSEDIDLFLFCLKMTERLDRHNIEEMKAVTDKFGEDIWKKGLFVLTFANEISKERFTSKFHQWESEIRKRLKKIIAPGVAEEIPVVPTGFKEPQLPDRPNWVSELCNQGLRRIGFKAEYYKAVLNIEKMGDELDQKKMAEDEYGSPEKQSMLKQENIHTNPRHSQEIDQPFGVVFFCLFGQFLAVSSMSVAFRKGFLSV